MLSTMPYPIVNRERKSRLPMKSEEELEKEKKARAEIQKRLQDQRRLRAEIEPKELRETSAKLLKTKHRTGGDVSKTDDNEGMPEVTETAPKQKKSGRVPGKKVLAEYAKNKAAA
jgi:hypothetical protein